MDNNLYFPVTTHDGCKIDQIDQMDNNETHAVITQIGNNNHEHETLKVTIAPTDKFDIVNKEYVDNLIENTKWENSVSNFYNPRNSLPKNPEKGERFVSTGTGHGWVINRIYECDGNNDAHWTEIIPEKGCIVWSQHQSGGSTHIFNGITWEKFGVTVEHTDLKSIGSYSHPKIDDHINNKLLHLREDIISHKKITDVGIFSHDSIDKHIQNSNNAHFGQNMTKNGTPEFRSVRVSDVSMSSHVATKDYVDSKILGLKWNKTTQSLFDPSNGMPEACIGNRYICLETVKGWKKNYIYEYNGFEWVEIMPTMEYATYVEGGNIYNGDTILFNGTEWIKFGTTGNHDNLSNIGTHSHIQIDSHVNNEINAHFGQDLKISGSPIFSNLFIHGKTATDSLVVNDQIIANKLQVGNVMLPTTIQKQSNLTIVGDDVLNATFIHANESSNDPINIIHMRARGDVYSPKELLKGTPIGALVYSGYDGEAYGVTSTIKCVTTDDYSKKSHGSSIQMSTTMNNTTSPILNMEIDHDGTVNCYCTKESFSKEDGAFVINGGMGINKNLFVGGSLKVGNNLYLHNDESTTYICNDTVDSMNNKIMDICGGNNSTTESGGHIVISGKDSSLEGKIQIKATNPNGNIELMTGNKQQLIIEKNGQCSILNSDETTSVSTGSLIANGGVGIRGNLYVGGSTILLGTNAKPTIRPDSDNSYLSLCGGCDDTTNHGGVIQLNGDDVEYRSGSVCISTGSSSSSKIYFSTGASNRECCAVNNLGEWHISTTTESVNVKTGALVVDGGIGIGQKLIANNIKCLNMLQLALFSNEKYDGEIGSIYYDTSRDCVRVFTKHGWRNLAFK
jgi:hypothetical protein